MQETIDFLERRSLAFCLASRLTAWPDGNTVPMAQSLASGLDDGLDDERTLAQLSQGMDHHALSDEYITLFERGSGRCPIHETEFGRMRGMSKGNELSDIAGFYNAFGMTTADTSDAREMHDHLAVELEFYGTLLARQAALLENADAEGVSIVEDARRKFLIDHLGRLARAVAQQDTVKQSALYSPILNACETIVQNECDRMGAIPAPLDFYANAAEPEDICCGATVSPAPATKV